MDNSPLKTALFKNTDQILGRLGDPVLTGGPNALVKVGNLFHPGGFASGTNPEFVLAVAILLLLNVDNGRSEGKVPLEKVGTVSSDACQHIFQNILSRQMGRHPNVSKVIFEGIVEEFYLFFATVSPQSGVHVSGFWFRQVVPSIFVDFLFFFRMVLLLFVGAIGPPDPSRTGRPLKTPNQRKRAHIFSVLYEFLPLNLEGVTDEHGTGSSTDDGHASSISGASCVFRAWIFTQHAVV
mmetsp:Transcript_15171/g.32598  ORF Transcript_15171/g.32598 Transcript_15171/m.32598 type:complete len:238 (-) Transcript_15171:28-741(-)